MAYYKDLRAHVHVVRYDTYSVNHYGFFILKQRRPNGIYMQQDFGCLAIGSKEALEKMAKEQPRKKMDWLIAPALMTTYGNIPLTERLPWVATHPDLRVEIMKEEALNQNFKKDD